MVGRLDCRVAVDCGSGGNVDTVAVVAVAGAVLFVSCAGVLVVDAVPGPQPTSSKIMINPVKYDLIKQNVLDSTLEL